MRLSPRRVTAALLLLPILIWLFAPQVHLVEEHSCDDEGCDHRFCSVFHDLFQEGPVELPAPREDARLLARSADAPAPSTLETELPLSSSRDPPASA